MILGVILMMNMMPSVAFNNFIMDPMRAMITHRAVQKLLEFKHNVENMWSCSTTPKPTDQSRYDVYRLHHLRSSPLKYYRPESLKKNLNMTQVYPKRLLLITTSKKENNYETLRYPKSRRYKFLPLNLNNAKSRLYLHINRFPVKMKQISSVPVFDKYNNFPARSEGYHTRIISSAEIDPKLKVNGTITLEIPSVMGGRQKRDNGVIRVKIPYVQMSCYKSQEPKMKREVWPLLGPYNQVPYSKKNEFDAGIVGQLSPGLASKRNNQMQLISKLSEMKAKEHIAEDNRLAEMHKTQEAKREFQERIGEQLDLLSEAKRADLRAKRSFEKVVKLERSLSEQDREIHRLKEFEDQLYEDLLESEAQVAMADMQIIPKFINEEDLQEFMIGPKFNLNFPNMK
ncbi:uncharacterized protein [Halyomorpha halys]|uniref:uncharacterized protein isoform X3 n=1 Tax=Halyomorpha halys TaxID=286706 RepID=UPI000D0C82A0|nr:uncharacterized protein LOC106681024 isoform X2 [Halyomorpha halys]